jgi:hypothetical protein
MPVTHPQTIAQILERRGCQWLAQAYDLGPGEAPHQWKVTTQCGGNGGRRHRWVRTEDEARAVLENWYYRRFQFVG